MEDDAGLLEIALKQIEFQSTSSVWRTTSAVTVLLWPMRFQSTSSVWRTTIGGRAVPFKHIFQSTSSVWRTTLGTRSNRRPDCCYFNPRPPCGGRLSIHTEIHSTGNFNPRPPCGGRPAFSRWSRSAWGISIHVLRVEDDLAVGCQTMTQHEFQSTSSVWRTTITLLIIFCSPF